MKCNLPSVIFMIVEKMTYLIRINNNIQLKMFNYSSSKLSIIESYYSSNKFKSLKCSIRK